MRPCGRRPRQRRGPMFAPAAKPLSCGPAGPRGATGRAEGAGAQISNLAARALVERWGPPYAPNFTLCPRCSPGSALLGALRPSPRLGSQAHPARMHFVHKVVLGAAGCVGFRQRGPGHPIASRLLALRYARAGIVWGARIRRGGTAPVLAGRGRSSLCPWWRGRGNAPQPFVRCASSPTRRGEPFVALRLLRAWPTPCVRRFARFQERHAGLRLRPGSAWGARRPGRLRRGLAPRRFDRNLRMQFEA